MFHNQPSCQQSKVQKSEWMERSSFNKHTGSLSNNVITDASLVEISQPDLSPKSSTEHRRPAHGAASKMNVQEMIKCADDVKNECDLGNMQDVNECDDGAMNDCDVVVRDACMENVSLPEKSVKSDKIKRKDPHSVSSLKSTNETRPKCRVKYRVVNSSGGKFSISAAKGDPDIQGKSEVKSGKKLSTVKANLEFFKI